MPTYLCIFKYIDHQNKTPKTSNLKHNSGTVQFKATLRQVDLRRNKETCKLGDVRLRRGECNEHKAKRRWTYHLPGLLLTEV